MTHRSSPLNYPKIQNPKNLVQELLDSRQTRIDQVLKEKQEVVNKVVILKREVKGLEQKYKRVVKEAEEKKEDHIVKFENLKRKSELVEKRFAMQHEDTRSRLHQYFSEIFIGEEVYENGFRI